jgi:hypothetical protein
MSTTHFSGAVDSIGGFSVNGTTVSNEQITCHLADAGTAGSAYVVAKVAGTLSSVSVVNYAANATTATVYTLKINGSAVTHPTLQHGASDAAGTAVTAAPTAANTVAVGDVISITSDGGSSSTMPITASFLISR